MSFHDFELALGYISHDADIEAVAFRKYTPEMPEVDDLLTPRQQGELDAWRVANPEVRWQAYQAKLDELISQKGKERLP